MPARLPSDPPQRTYPAPGHPELAGSNPPNTRSSATRAPDTQPNEEARQNRASDRGLWTPEHVVDNRQPTQPPGHSEAKAPPSTRQDHPTRPATGHPNPAVPPQLPPNPPQPTWPTIGHSNPAVPAGLPSGPPQPTPGRTGSRWVLLAPQDHLPQEPPIYSLTRKPDRTGAAIEACGQQNTLWTTTRQSTQTWPLDPRTQRCQLSARQVRPTHLADHWTLGRSGATPARPRRPCQPSPWTLGPCGAIPAAVRSAPAHLPSAWTVGLAGARCSMGGPVLCGGTAAVASVADRAMLFGPCCAVLPRVS
ncbi:hypothetical protein LV75_001861 [Actinokineospora diospyrosa]|uniref:Uncharacterized protein n=1 Tax=Actinokineospora diospyrosa TaxID=103728 RepID=A0ABT1I9Y3_9PSEU|nr:hypothetical protein [Actinokineospora diospyrosa]